MLERVERGGLPVAAWSDLAILGVDAVLTTRAGGVSTGPYASLNLGLHVGDDPDLVRENRARAARAIGLELRDLVLARQVHGRAVALVGAGDRGAGALDERSAVASADVLVTDAHGVGLALLVADCVPVLVVDPEVPRVALVHAGWRGAAAGVVPAAVQSLVDQGANRQRLLAKLGPCVGQDRFEVGDEVVERFTHLGVDVAAHVDRSGARPHLDLAGVVVAELVRSGVGRAHVERSPVTTGGDGFFSDRAERPCGRFGLLCRLGPPARGEEGGP